VLQAQRLARILHEPRLAALRVVLRGHRHAHAGDVAVADLALAAERRIGQDGALTECLDHLDVRRLTDDDAAQRGRNELRH